MNKRKRQHDTSDELLKEGIELYENRKKKENDVSNNSINAFFNKKIQIKCKNKRQKDFLDIIDNNEITLCLGSAGVGKSYLSIAKALELLIDKKNSYKKIYIMTPIVEAEDSLGYLKGTLAEKVYPYIYSTYYLIDKIIGKECREKLVAAGIIETVVLSYMRGMNIDDTIVISEESQNISKKGMKLLLSRIGYNTKMIISGDVEQCDKFKIKEDSGLFWAIDKLKDVDSLGIFEFSKEDIIRNPIISKILDKLDN